MGQLKAREPLSHFFNSLKDSPLTSSAQWQSVHLTHPAAPLAGPCAGPCRANGVGSTSRAGLGGFFGFAPVPCEGRRFSEAPAAARRSNPRPASARLIGESDCPFTAFASKALAVVHFEVRKDMKRFLGEHACGSRFESCLRLWELTRLERPAISCHRVA